MATRKIKNAKDLETGELIYFAGHAEATFMSNGKSVEEAINGLESGGGQIDLSDYATKEEFNSTVDLLRLDIDDINDDIALIEGNVVDINDSLSELDNNIETLQRTTVKYDTNAEANFQSVPMDAIWDSAGTMLIAFPSSSDNLKSYADITLQEQIDDIEEIRQGAAKGATALQSYTEKYTGTITGITMNGVSKGTSGVVNLGTVITAHQDISGKADKSSLAAVATSGSYNDLSNKPTIPSAVTESTVSGWGFTKNTGTYSKPSGGIPKTDLASAVQTSLGKADTALQSYTEQYKGTVTGVKINGSTKNPSNGVVDLGTVITSHQDISGKQDKLVSGTNIKTINGESILGEGNISISGSGVSPEYVDDAIANAITSTINASY